MCLFHCVDICADNANVIVGKTVGTFICIKAACSVTSVSQLFATPWTVVHQAPLSVGFPRQEHWSGLLFSSPGNLPDPRIEPMSPALQADSLPLNHLGSPNLPINLGIFFKINTLFLS